MSDNLIKIIHDDVKEIKKDLEEVKITNAIQNQQLGEHMRRTKNVEERVNKLENLKWISGAVLLIAGALGKYLGVY